MESMRNSAAGKKAYVLFLSVLLTSGLLTCTTDTTLPVSPEMTALYPVVAWKTGNTYDAPLAVDSVRITVTSPSLDKPLTGTFSFSQNEASLGTVPSGIAITIKIEGITTDNRLLYEGETVFENVTGKTLFAEIEASNVTPLPPDTLYANKSDSALTLSWQASFHNEIGYIVYRREHGDSAYSVLDTVTDLTYTDTALKEEISYDYKISAFNETGKSLESIEIRGLILQCNCPPALDTTTLPADEYLVFSGETYYVVFPAIDSSTISSTDTIHYSFSHQLTLRDDTLDWQTTLSDTGENHFFITIFNQHGDSTRYEWSVIVNENDTPTIEFFTPIDTTIAAGTELVISFAAKDPDNEHIRIYTDLTDLPATHNANLDTLHNTFTWYASTADTGMYDIIFYASDGFSLFSDTAHITVAPRNQRPKIETISDTTIRESERLDITLSARDENSVEMVYYAKYIDFPVGHSATFDTTTRIFSWTPNRGSAGYFTVRFYVTDGELTDSLDVLITVLGAENLPPRLSLPKDTTIKASETFTWQIAAVDAEQDTVTITANLMQLPGESDAHFNDSTSLFSWTPTIEDIGQKQVIFTADDGQLAVTDTVTIIVTQSNRAPVFDTLKDTTIYEGYQLYLTVAASDPDNDVIAYSADVSEFPTKNMPAFDTVTGVFTWTPLEGDTGQYTQFFIASDYVSADTLSVIINVGVNLPPILSAPQDTIIVAGEKLVMAISGSDPEMRTTEMTAHLSALPQTNTAIFDPVQATLAWEPEIVDTGMYKVPFTISDGYNSVTDTVTISVVQPNKAPVISCTADTIAGVMEGNEIKFRVSAHDTDSDKVYFTTDFADLPAGNQPSFSTATGDFSWIPEFDSDGIRREYSVWFFASDTKLTDTLRVRITVHNVNRPPICSIDLPGNKQLFQLGEHVEITVHSADPDGNLVNSALFINGEMVAQTADTTFTHMWTATGSGTAVFSAVAYDMDESTDTAEVSITVNAPPEFSNLIPPVKAGIGNAYTGTVTAQDSDDGDTPTYRLLSGPDGFTINSTSGAINWYVPWTVQISFDSILTVSVEATDGRGGYDTLQWNIMLKTHTWSPVENFSVPQTLRLFTINDSSLMYGAYSGQSYVTITQTTNGGANWHAVDSVGWMTHMDPSVLIGSDEAVAYYGKGSALGFWNGRTIGRNGNVKYSVGADKGGGFCRPGPNGSFYWYMYYIGGVWCIQRDDDTLIDGETISSLNPITDMAAGGDNLYYLHKDEMRVYRLRNGITDYITIENSMDLETNPMTGTVLYGIAPHGIIHRWDTWGNQSDTTFHDIAVTRLVILSEKVGWAVGGGLEKELYFTNDGFETLHKEEFGPVGGYEITDVQLGSADNRPYVVFKNGGSLQLRR